MNLLTEVIISGANTLYNVTRPYTTEIEKPFLPLSAPYYDIVRQIDASTNLGEGAVMYISSLLLSYPLALIQRRLPPGLIRHVYSAFFGLLFSFLIFGWMAMHQFIPALVAYMSMVILPKGLATKITFAFAFFYLSVCHVYRMSIDYLGWSLDFSSLQMLATLKIISCAFNVYDGTKPDDQVIPIWRKNSINRVPNPLEYISYLTFYPCVLSGPVYELQDYLKFIESPSKDLPWSPLQIGKMAGSSLWCMGLYLLLSPYFSPETLKAPYIYTVSFGRAVFDAIMVGIATRQKYFVAWYLAEGAAVTAGFGFDPLTKKWDRIEHADFFGVEFAVNLRGLIINWNKAVSRWLRYYVYTRVGPIEAHVPGGRKKPTLINTVVTFSVSALWHGFYPGYYLMWTVMAIAQNVATGMHRKTRPRIINDANKAESEVKKTIYKFFGWVLTVLTVAYYTTSFQLLDFHDSVRWFNRMYWSGHIITIALFAIITVLPTPKVKAA